ncbi:MAG: hypothetical protein JW821_10830 [Deltaproteobacteria bacterium]|nr:hypothetical protein [Deltaproteobacteria bacterium]
MKEPSITHRKDKTQVIRVLQSSVQKIKQGIDDHCCLVASILQEQLVETNLLPLLELCPDRSREYRLKSAIKEAIDVLEESRKAFKSKRLEALRKKLTQVLIDAG